MFSIGLFQCRKPEFAYNNSGFENQKQITVNASSDNHDSKVDGELSGLDKIVFKWKKGDNLSVFHNNINIGTLNLVSGEGTNSAMFSGGIKIPSSITTNDDIVFKYSKGSPDEPDLLTQDGTIDGANGINSKIHLTGSAKFNKDGVYSNVKMSLTFAILKLDLSALGTADGNDVTISKGEYDNIITTISGVTNNTSVRYYVALPPDKGEYIFSGNNIYSYRLFTIHANRYYYKESGNAHDGIEIDRYVDLGLTSGTLWASCNVGADKREDPGNHFWLATTEPFSVRNNKIDPYKYWNNQDLSDIFIKDEFDAATVNWGTNWCMPKIAQIKELVNNTTRELKTISDKSYIVFKSKVNNNELWIPLAGFYSIDYSSAPGCVNTEAAIWSRSHAYDICAWAILIYKTGVCDINGTLEGTTYDYFFSVRPVRSSPK